MSEIALTTQTSAATPTPGSGKVNIFVNSATGEPSYKDSAGTTTSLKGVAGAAGGVTSACTTLTSSSGVLAINCALGNYFKYTATENITSITFSNLPAAATAETIMLEFTQHASSPKTVAWPSAFKWSGGAAVVSSTNSAIDVVAFTTFDQGTTWRASIAKAFA